MIKFYSRPVLVNNPYADVDVEEEKRWMENIKERKISRTTLLNYLGESCGEIYKPQSLEELNNKIDNYMKEKERLEKELRAVEKNPQLETEKKNEIEVVKRNIHQIIIDFLQEKDIKWTGVTQVAVGTAGVVVTVASIVVPLACKIM